MRASREGDWDLHLHSIRMMIPWCFAYDKVNYSRYLTPYFAQMTNLGDKNPEVQKAFKEGSFSAQLASSNPFGRIPVDQTTEVTVNKDTQNPDGTTRFSLKPSTVQRYYLKAEYQSARGDRKPPAASLQRLTCEARQESKLSGCYMETVFRERPTSSDSCWTRMED